ncbi:MAG: ParA family protein [Actinobacteria bacterium]|nr:ParA family protein [Actinomycetota bacterium]
MPRVIVVAVVNTKGGSSKTTTAVFLAHAMHEQGRRVALVDADPQRSAVNWSQYAGGFPFPVFADLDKPDLHQRLRGVVGTDYEVAVIDTPPIDQVRGVVVSALTAATVVLVPVAPTPAEIERMPAVLEAITRSAGLRVSGEPPASIYRRRATGCCGHRWRAWSGSRRHSGDRWSGPHRRRSATRPTSY